MVGTGDKTLCAILLFCVAVIFPPLLINTILWYIVKLFLTSNQDFETLERSVCMCAHTCGKTSVYILVHYVYLY
jgi:hypothetical protein